MAIVSKESIFASGTVKPSTFVVWCLLCQVKDSRQKDVYLSIDMANLAGIKKSAYYSAFAELEREGWITLSGSKNGQKRWILVKGFSANVENNSANVEFQAKNNSANVDSDSANVENNSANVESPPAPPIRNINRPKKPTKDNQPSERENAHAKSFTLISDNDFLHTFRLYYPGYDLSIHQQEIIQTRIRDGTNWEKALAFWAGNAYRPQSVGKICDKYDELVNNQNGGSNGTIQRHNQSNDAGTRNAQRIDNSNAAIAELFRQGQVEQNLLGDGNAVN